MSAASSPIASLSPPAEAAVSRAAKIGCALLLLCTPGCSEQNAKPGTHMPKRVSLQELEEATRADPCTAYCGADPVCHHFLAWDGREFLVDRAEWNLHPVLSVDGGARLFVKVEGGKIKMADMRGQHIPVALRTSSREMRLPVMRYDRSDQPPLLILSSDGGWSEDDLSRLDGVLSDWLIESIAESESVTATRVPGYGSIGRILPVTERQSWFDARTSTRAGANHWRSAS